MNNIERIMTLKPLLPNSIIKRLLTYSKNDRYSTAINTILDEIDDQIKNYGIEEGYKIKGSKLLTMINNAFKKNSFNVEPQEKRELNDSWEKIKNQDLTSEAIKFIKGEESFTDNRDAIISIAKDQANKLEKINKEELITKLQEKPNKYENFAKTNNHAAGSVKDNIDKSIATSNSDRKPNKYEAFVEKIDNKFK